LPDKFATHSFTSYKKLKDHKSDHNNHSVSISYEHSVVTMVLSCTISNTSQTTQIFHTQHVYYAHVESNQTSRKLAIRSSLENQNDMVSGSRKLHRHA